MFNRILAYLMTAVLAAICTPGSLLPDDNNENVQKAEIKLLTPSSVTIPSTGGETTIEFDASEDWAISATIPGSDNGKDWLIIKGTSGDKGKGRTVVELKANDTDADRNFTINIYAGLLQSQTVEHISVKQPCKANDNTGGTGSGDGGDSGSDSGESGSGSGEDSGSDSGEEGSPEDAEFLARIDDTQYSTGPDYLFVTVDVTNQTSSSAKVEFGLEFSSSDNFSNPLIVKGGEATLAAGAKESAECFVDGLEEQTCYYFRPYAKVGDRKYLGQSTSRTTDKPYLYLNGEYDTQYSYGEQGGNFELLVYSNLIDYQMKISADWVKIVEEEHLYHNHVNAYLLAVDANDTESGRSAKIVFSNDEYGLSFEVSVDQTRKVDATGETDGHAWVNLALPSGTLWATMNVDAAKPEEYGRYVAWGEIVTLGEEDLENEYNHKNYETYTKTSFSADSYKFFHDEEYQDGDNIWQVGKTHVLHKYCKDDGLESLEPEDDVATVKWGEKWTMPTGDQLRELVKYTHYVWTENYKGTGINGGVFYRMKADGATYDPEKDVHIFIPASGYREYKESYNQGKSCLIWAKTLRDPKYAGNPYYDVERLFFDDWIKYSETRDGNRDMGLCVRAVVKQ